MFSEDIFSCAEHSLNNFSTTYPTFDTRLYQCNQKMVCILPTAETLVRKRVRIDVSDLNLQKYLKRQQLKALMSGQTKKHSRMTEI